MWDQQETLAPFPWPKSSRTARILQGLNYGDSSADKLSDKEIIRSIHGGPVIVEDVKCEWVDWKAVKRGQEVWKRLEIQFLLSLFACLVYGYSLARFSDVLVLAGYARSPRETFMRFKHTAAHVRKWMHYDLSDPKSPGRISIAQVRSMHALARKRAASAWAKARSAGDTEIGVPLSQFDMAQVQMAFSTICLSAVENEFYCVLTEQERDDYIHLWRLIGRQLGIDDQYNVCISTEDALALRDEFFSAVPHFMRSLRPSTKLLIQSTLHGFGNYYGVGAQFFGSFLEYTALKRDWLRSSKYESMPSSRLGVLFFKLLGQCSKSSWIRIILSTVSMGHWRLAESHPKVEDKIDKYFINVVGRLIASGFWLGDNLLLLLQRSYESSTFNIAAILMMGYVFHRITSAR